MDTTYRVPAANVEALQEQIAELNKKAEKLGTRRITLTQIGIEVEKRRNAAKIEIPFVWHLFTVDGETPKLAGYTFIAVIEQLGEENLVKNVPGHTCPVEFRKTDYHCDHCNTDRRRKEVFVLRHDDGAYKQVGRNCLADFLGGKSPEGVLAWATILFSLETTIREAGDERWGGTRWSPSIDEYVAVIAICIRRMGWISKKAAESMFPEPMTTSYLGWRVCCDSSSPTMREMIRDNDLYVEDRDLELAKAALEWARALSATGDDYHYNLGVACRAGIVNLKTSGIIASVISAYQRHRDRVEELNLKSREPFLDEHVGEVNTRVGFTGLTVKAMRSFDSNFGVKTLVRFKDAAGRTLIWWASGEIDWLEEGKTYDITGTIKEHGSHNNYKQTVLQRVKEGLPKAKKAKAA
jgi:hypothetical protein